MQAMVINQFGGPEQLILKDIPMPVPGNGEVLIKVKALGINRAELYMRKGLFGEVTPVSGIECVGQVEDDPGGTLQRGQAVATITGEWAAQETGAMPNIPACPYRMSFLSKPTWTGQLSLPYQNPTRRPGVVSLPICASGPVRCCLCAAEHPRLDRPPSLLPNRRE